MLDDISALLQEDCFRDMLKGLCESGRRVLHWGTTTSKLDGRPRSFACTAPVLIVMNKIPSRDADVAAILDRCDAIEFAPTKPEVIARMHELFPAEAELIDLIAELPTLPSLRTLIKARRWQRFTSTSTWWRSCLPSAGRRRRSSTWPGSSRPTPKANGAPVTSPKPA